MPVTEPASTARLSIENQRLRAEIERTRMKLQVSRIRQGNAFARTSARTTLMDVGIYAGLFLTGSALTVGLYALVATFLTN